MTLDATLDGAVFVVFGGIDWSFNWQVHQEVPSRFAAAGHRVLYIENTGVRRPGFRDLPRLVSRFRNWRRSRGGAAGSRQGVSVLSPMLVPLPYSKMAQAFNARLLLRTIRRWIGKRERPLVVITFLPTPLVRSIVARLAPDLLVYYAVDALAESSPGARRIVEHQNAMFREAALVFTTSSGIQKLAADLGVHAELMPHGVHCQEIEEARQSAPASLLNDIPRPIAGFVGSVRDELDLELLRVAAESAPDVQFVFAGPVTADVRALQALPNVRFVGAVPHADAIRYTAGFDAGMLPYVRNAYTAHILPAKFKEFLAAGLPVIATSLPQVREFAELHGDVVTFADDGKSFAAAIRRNVQENGPDAAARRTAVARRYDWATQIARMRHLMDEAMLARGRARA